MSGGFLLKSTFRRTFDLEIFPSASNQNKAILFLTKTFLFFLTRKVMCMDFVWSTWDRNLLRIFEHNWTSIDEDDSNQKWADDGLWGVVIDDLFVSWKALDWQWQSVENICRWSMSIVDGSRFLFVLVFRRIWFLIANSRYREFEHCGISRRISSLECIDRRRRFSFRVIWQRGFLGNHYGLNSFRWNDDSVENLGRDRERSDRSIAYSKLYHRRRELNNENDWRRKEVQQENRENRLIVERRDKRFDFEERNTWEKWWRNIDDVWGWNRRMFDEQSREKNQSRRKSRTDLLRLNVVRVEDLQPIQLIEHSLLGNHK